MCSRLRLLAIVSVAVVCAACAPITVRSYVERGANISAYRTYNWQPVGARSTGDPRLDNNRFFYDRIQSAVDAQLTGKGYEKTTSPDVLVLYHANIEPDGTLLIDLVDARSDRLLWRGWATGGFDAAVDDQSWMEKRIDETVGRILKRLPHRL